MQTTTNAKTVQSETQEESFVSEDVYARTSGAFTRVSCVDTYAFSSIATSNDFSEIADSVGSMIQVGVEIEFPNGRREMLVFSPRNLLHTNPVHRKEIISAIFSGGELWIAEYDDVFTPAGFPKSWDTMVVPTVHSAESVFNYREESLTNYDPSGKEQVSAFAGGLGLLMAFIVAGGIGMVVFNSMIPFAIALGVYFSGLFLADDYILQKVRDYVSLDVSHLWMQRMEISEEELNSCTPMSEDMQSEVQTALIGLEEKWTRSTVINVKESHDYTELDLITSQGKIISVQYNTPADNSDRFVLNRLVDEKNVGSVKMLEGEELFVSLTSLGKEDDIAKDGFYRFKGSKPD